MSNRSNSVACLDDNAVGGTGGIVLVEVLPCLGLGGGQHQAVITLQEQTLDTYILLDMTGYRIRRKQAQGLAYVPSYVDSSCHVS